jgi:FMN-dependent NADH-azoreductase
MMATVLYMTAHPLTETQSYSLRVGKAFLDSYREAAPNDQMTFFGVPSFEGLFVEGHNAQPDRAEEILANAIMRTPEVAKRFAAPVNVPVHAWRRVTGA